MTMMTAVLVMTTMMLVGMVMSETDFGVVVNGLTTYCIMCTTLIPSTLCPVSYTHLTLPTKA